MRDHVEKSSIQMGFQSCWNVRNSNQKAQVKTSKQGKEKGEALLFTPEVVQN